MANNIFENKDVKNRHVDLKTVSESPWYKYLGADRLISSDTSHLSSAQVYIYNKELQSDQLKDFRCLQLDGDMILHFPFDTTAYDYYIKSYKVDETSKRLKYTSLKTRYNLIQLDDGSNATIPAGKYGLNGWDILAVSKNDMLFYRYKDGTSEQEYLYARGSTHFIEDIIKDKTIDKNKVIINEASNFGNLAEYEIPGYYGIGNAGKAKTITLFGNINSVPEERKDFSFNQLLTYGNKNSTSTSAKMINQVPMRMRPYILFEDFGEYPDSNNVPSDLWHLVYHYDSTNNACSLSFHGQTIQIKLYDDDKIILYIRDDVGAENITSLGQLMLYARRYYRTQSHDIEDYHILNSVYAKGGDDSEIEYLVNGWKINKYDITKTDWVASDAVKCDLVEDATDYYNSIIQKNDIVLEYDKLNNLDNKNDSADDFICMWYNCIARSYSVPTHTITNSNLKDILKRKIKLQQVPYIVSKPLVSKSLIKGADCELKRGKSFGYGQNHLVTSVNFQNIYNTSITTTVGILQPGNLKIPYYENIDNTPIDVHNIDEINLKFAPYPITTTYTAEDYSLDPTDYNNNKIDTEFKVYNAPTNFDIVSYQGFNKIVTSEVAYYPYGNKRTSAFAIVLWRRHTNEPITQKIEKLS